MINSLTDLFGETAVNQASVQATPPLLPADGAIGLADGFNNGISYVEGLYKVGEALANSGRLIEINYRFCRDRFCRG